MFCHIVSLGFTTTKIFSTSTKFRLDLLISKKIVFTFLAKKFQDFPKILTIDFKNPKIYHKEILQKIPSGLQN